MLQWFVDEQVEEEKIVDDIKKQLIRNKIKHNRSSGYRREHSDPEYDEQEHQPSRSRTRVKRIRHRR